MAQGAIAEDKVNTLSKAQILELVFQSGLTTKSHSSIVSGRGFGLSALKESVEAINGTIKVDSAVNEGTVFTLTIPKPSA